MSWQRFADKRDRVQTRSGYWAISGEATLHGFNIHKELVPNATWMQTMVLALTGRLHSTKEARFLEALCVATGYPDPRFWCNRVVALAGSARCPGTASLAAGIGSAEGTFYGRQADYQTARFIQTAKRILDERGETELECYTEKTLRDKRAVPGFGRPLRKVEERIIPLESLAQRLGIEPGPHLMTVRRVARYLGEKRIIMNYSGYAVARFLDLGMSAREAYLFGTLVFYCGLLPCYIEAFENEPGTFLPIACEDVRYEGVSEREVPT